MKFFLTIILVINVELAHQVLAIDILGLDMWNIKVILTGSNVVEQWRQKQLDGADIQGISIKYIVLKITTKVLVLKWMHTFGTSATGNWIPKVSLERHPFNDLFSRTTWYVGSRKVKPSGR